jgi:hypothetical protein
MKTICPRLCTVLSLAGLGLVIAACGSSSNKAGLNSGDDAGAGGGDEDGSTGSGGDDGAGGSKNGTGGKNNGKGGAAAAGGRTGSGGRPGAGGFVPAECAAENADLPPNAPALKVGEWVNISPAGVPFDSTATAYTQGMDMDPCNPATLYVAIVGDPNVWDTGIYRTVDAGASWTRIGPMRRPVRVRVDPRDPKHLYVGDGVGGPTNGFWVSHDGGDTWEMPPAFKAEAEKVHCFDVYHVEPDPADFNHVLVSFHNYWQGLDGIAGVFESFDGGESFIVHQPPAQGWNWAGGYNVFFLYDPVRGIGNRDTWLYGTQGKGYWRTTNAGDTWTKVSDNSMEHGGGTVYYSNDALYVSGTPHILKSTNNGETFTEIGRINGYMSIIGDGTNLYTGGHGGGPFVTAPEGDDTNWKDFNAQTFPEGPFQMAVDKKHNIIYSASIRSGIFALKTQ